MTEATDPYCLRAGESAALLAGHPWRRFAVLGDSVAEGAGDPVDGYRNLPWADRIAAELAEARPGFEYLNLGVRNLRASQVRGRQLEPALAFGPDLAMVVCGANDALRPGFDPAAVDREIETMVTALRGRGTDVMTVSVFVLDDYPGVPDALRRGFSDRLRILARSTTALARRLGTIHVDLASHPAGYGEAMHSGDGVHGNGRSHGIAAAEAVRTLGAHLGNTFREEPA
jgi:lysophospholipase L1-like esterase